LAESKERQRGEKHMATHTSPKACTTHQYFSLPVKYQSNLHRPCMFATSKVNDKGKVVKVHKHADVKHPLLRRFVAQCPGSGEVQNTDGSADLLASSSSNRPHSTGNAASQERTIRQL
jgi:hypothetical protein